MVGVPQLLQLFWNGLEREIERQGKESRVRPARRIARYLPYWARRMLFRRIHTQLGGGLPILVIGGAYLPPALQQAWEDLGVIVIQGYGATEMRPGDLHDRAGPPDRHGGQTMPPVEVRLADGPTRSSFGGPTVFDGYWKDPDATAAVMTGRLVPDRRHRPLRRARATWCSRAGPRTSSCCPTA